MPTIDRSAIIRGPAEVQFGGQVFFSKGNVSVSWENSVFEKTSDVFGVIGRAKTDTQITVSFTPVGELEALAVLFPYGQTALGSSIFGSSDSALIIKGLANQWTIHNAAVTQMPSLTLGAGTTAFGEVQFTGRVKKSGEPDDKASYYAYTESSNSYSTTFDPANVKSAEYQAFYLGYTHSSTDGFTVDFDVNLAPVTVDSHGTIDMTLVDVGFSANWSPISQGTIPSSLLQLLANTAPGSDLSTTSLTIAGTGQGISFTADKATLVSSDFVWGADANLNGPITVQGTRDINSGALDPLFAVGTV